MKISRTVGDKIPDDEIPKLVKTLLYKKGRFDFLFDGREFDVKIHSHGSGFQADCLAFELPFFVKHHMDRWFAKLSVAMHYEHSSKRVSSGSLIEVRMFAPHNEVRNIFPSIDRIPFYSCLANGSSAVLFDVFRYKVWIDDLADTSIFYFSIRGLYKAVCVIRGPNFKVKLDDVKIISRNGFFRLTHDGLVPIGKNSYEVGLVKFRLNKILLSSSSVFSFFVFCNNFVFSLRVVQKKITMSWAERRNLLLNSFRRHNR